MSRDARAAEPPFIHPLALCESELVGEATRVWAFAHVMKGATVGAQCNIGEGAFVESGAVLGDRVTLKNQVLVWDGVRIEDDVFVGPGVVFTNDKSPRSPRMPEVGTRYRDPATWRVATTIGRGASLGGGSVILPGVVVGPFAMVGAGAVVTRDVPTHRVVVGNPARPVGWACVCGATLGADDACPSCARAYRREGEAGLRPVEIPSEE